MKAFKFKERLAKLNSALKERLIILKAKPGGREVINQYIEEFEVRLNI